LGPYLATGRCSLVVAVAVVNQPGDGAGVFGGEPERHRIRCRPVGLQGLAEGAILELGGARAVAHVGQADDVAVAVVGETKRRRTRDERRSVGEEQAADTAGALHGAAQVGPPDIGPDAAAGIIKLSE